MFQAVNRLWGGLLVICSCFLAGTLPLAVAAQEAGFPQGDPEAGAVAFRQCSICHTFSVDQQRLGPHLIDIIGRPAAAVAGYQYSAALRAADLVWTKSNLAAYITDPRSFVPGGTMVIPVRDLAQVPDIIAYLEAESLEADTAD